MSQVDVQSLSLDAQPTCCQRTSARPIGRPSPVSFKFKTGYGHPPL